MQPPFRIGFGYDVHKLEDDAPFTLGGIQINHKKGAVGHSDADVLIHAICDGLLGAANLGDIGLHFPDTSVAYKGIDSRILLREVCEKVRSVGYDIGNIDSTIALQEPKLRPHIEKMQTALSAEMQISPEQISIKATTTERLGFVGTEEGIAAYAVVLLMKKS